MQPRPWEALPHPTPDVRAARHAARQAAALVRECRLAHVTQIDLSVSGPPVDAAIRRWWSGWARRSLLPVGLLVLGPGGRCYLFTVGDPDAAAVLRGLRRALEETAAGLSTGTMRVQPMTPPMTGKMTPTEAAAREVRLLLAATAEGRRRGRHRYLFAGR